MSDVICSFCNDRIWERSSLTNCTCDFHEICFRKHFKAQAEINIIDNPVYNCPKCSRPLPVGTGLESAESEELERSNEEIEQLKMQLIKTQSSNAAMTKKIDDQQGNISELQAKLEKSDEALASAENRISYLNSVVNKLLAKLLKKRQELEEANSHIKELNKEIKQYERIQKFYYEVMGGKDVSQQVIRNLELMKKKLREDSASTVRSTNSKANQLKNLTKAWDGISQAFSPEAIAELQTLSVEQMRALQFAEEVTDVDSDSSGDSEIPEEDPNLDRRVLLESDVESDEEPDPKKKRAFKDEEEIFDSQDADEEDNMEP